MCAGLGFQRCSFVLMHLSRRLLCALNLPDLIITPSAARVRTRRRLLSMCGVLSSDVQRQSCGCESQHSSSEPVGYVPAADSCCCCGCSFPRVCRAQDVFAVNHVALVTVRLRMCLWHWR